MSDFESDLGHDLPRGFSGGGGQLVEAQWLDPAELTHRRWRYADEQGRAAGLLLGYRGGRGIGLLDDRHLVTIAGSRAGKGVSHLVPNMLRYEGSVMAIDPKGDLARITARARKRLGQKVVVLDPYHANGVLASGAFNPLDEIAAASPQAIGQAALIADALIMPNERDPHWTDSARQLLKALILFTLTLPPGDRHLVTTRRLLTLAHPVVRATAKELQSDWEAALFKLLQGCAGRYDDLVAATGASFASMGEKERSSILSTARTQTEFLDGPELAGVLTRSDFRLAELKTSKVTVYLSLPATAMGPDGRWLRVILALALAAFERERTKPEIPVLLLLDEFHVLGHFKAIETSAGLVAGFGVKLWTVLQDIGQLKRHYRESWETFIANAGVLSVWGNSDQTTLEYISQRLGQTGVRIMQPSGATSGARLAGASALREELRVQRLLAPHEVESLLAREKRRVLVMAAGSRPVILQRPIYYEDKPFAGLFDG